MKLILYRKNSDKSIVISDTNINNIEEFVKRTKECFNNPTLHSYTIKTNNDIVICKSQDLSIVHLAFDNNENLNKKSNKINDDIIEEEIDEEELLEENFTNIQILDDEEEIIEEDNEELNQNMLESIDEESQNLIKMAMNNLDNEDQFDEYKDIDDTINEEI